MSHSSDQPGIRLLLLGPALPHRGGISQQFTLTARALKDQARLYCFSYKRLYPKLLYPGKTTIEPGYEDHKEPGVDYILDSLNPTTWYSLLRKITRIKPDSIVIPWWSVFHAPHIWTIAYFANRMRIPIIFFCHNVVEHETAWWRRKITKSVLNLGSAFITHSTRQSELLRKMKPNCEVVYSPLPPGLFLPTHPIETKQSTSSLKIIFFGFIRRYKGLDILLSAVNKLKRNDFELTIVGEIWQDKQLISKLISDSPHRDKITLVSRYVSEQEAAEYFSSSDLLVLPYRTITGSGIVPMAQYFNLPMVVSDVGDLKHHVKHGETGLVVSPNSVDDLATTLEHISHNQLTAMRENISLATATLDQSWAKLIESIIDLVKSLKNDTNIH